MKSSGTVFKLLVVVLALSSFAFAQSAMGAQLDLTNPSTGNPATQDPISVSPGDTLTVNILLTSGGDSVAGTGNDIAFDTSVFSSPSATAGQVATDAGKFVTSSEPTSGVFRVGILGFNANVIADGVVAVVTFTVATDATPGTYTLSNTPSATDPTGVDLTTTGSNATIIVAVTGPALTISKADSPDPVTAGSNLTYTLTYTNVGTESATSVVITDTVPANTTFVSATDGGAESGGVVTWNVGTVAASATGTVSFTVAVSGSLGAGDTVTNSTYSIDSADTEPVSGSSVSTDVNVAPVVEAGANQTAVEGDTVSLDPVTFTDGDTSDTHAATIDWGDGTITDPATVTSGTVSGSHVYTDNGAFTVTVTVTDNNGASGSDTLTVTVSNAAPVVDAGSDQTGINEGDTVSVSATFTDAGSSDTHTATIDWGDGTQESGAVTEPSSPGTVTGSHVYADEGTGIYTVTVTVTDDDGGFSSDTLTVNVSNVAPVIDAGSDQTAAEGDTVNLAATFTDAGSGDTHTATIDWGDGSGTETGAVNETAGTVTGSHVYADEGTYTVTVAIDDGDGGTHSDTLTVTVSNADPVVNAGTDQTITEGGTVSLAPATFTDGGTTDTHTATIDWGDGTSPETGVVSETNGSGSVSGSHTYAEDGTYTVTVTVTDNDGGSGNDTLIVTVNNAAAVVDAGADQTGINEGDTVSVSVTFTDVGVEDTHTATINWGDGTTDTASVGESMGQGGFSGTHAYADNGTFTVTVTVTDDDGGAGTDTLTVTVDNVAPVVVAGSDQTGINEGDTVSLSSTFTDVGTADTHTAAIDWGDGTGADTGTVTETSGSGTVTGSHVYADNGTYTVTVTVTDDDSGSHSDTFTVTVSNVAPVVNAGADASSSEGDFFNLAATFTDAGSGDTHTATIDWGDGSSPESGTVNQTAGTITGSHIYTVVGSYTVTVTIMDDDGASDSDTLALTVVPNNLPVVEAGADHTITENDTISLDPATFTDADTSDTHTATIDWGDGTVETGTLTESGGAGSISGTHQYLDSGTFTVTITVTDNKNGSGSDTFTVTSANALPVVEAGADQTAAEGDTVSLAPATFTDIGTIDTHTATIDWGDGTVDTGTVTEPSSAGTVAGSHVYADDGAYTVTVTVTDDNGGAGSDTFTVTVSNAAPVVEAGADQTATEGDTVSLAATFTDAGSGDTHTASIDWGDGTSPDTGAVSAGEVTGSHVYTDDGAFTVTVTVTDDDGASASDTFTVTVSNATPVVEAGSNQTVDEGVEVSISASFTDTGSADTHTATINWGDGTVETVTPVSGTVSGAHTYLDDGTFTVKVTVTDDDSASGSDTLTVTAGNASPAVDAGIDQTVAEGDTVNLSATFTDTGGRDTHTATIDWGDGTTETGTLTEPSSPGTVTGSHVYTDDGTYTVTVTVTDDDGASASDTLTVTVTNASPVVEAGADQNAGVLITFLLTTPTFSDAGSADTHTATIDWGDGSGTETGTLSETAGTVTGSHTYSSTGTFTLTVTVTDDDGASTSDTLTITVVESAAPVVNAGADQTAAEGATVSLSGTFTDEDATDTHTATINWGDGTTESGAVAQTAGTVTGSHVYADNGSYTVTLTVTDSRGASATDTLTVTVSNVDPVVEAGADQTATEGKSFSLSAPTFTDAGTGDTHTATIDWGDDSSPTTGTVTESSGSGSVSGSHTYAEDGTYTVTVTVTDDDGGSHSDTLTVTVSNAAPVVEAGADQFVEEGDTVSLSPATFTDAGSSDTHTATIDWGDGSDPDTGTLTEPSSPGTVAGSHTYTDDGTYTVTITVTDSDGGSGSDTFTVKVSNVAPAVSAGSDQTVNENDSVSLSSVFSDVGSSDTHTATIDWGDGTTESGTVDQSGGTVTGSHTYSGSGIFTVTVTVTDDDGGSTSDTMTVTVKRVGVNIFKTVSSSTVRQGENLTYTITYDNSGEVDLTGVVITDTVPTDTTFVSATGGGTESGGVVTWSIGGLTASSSGSVSFTVAVSSSVQSGATISNTTYSIDSDQSDPVSGNPVDVTVVVPSITSVTPDNAEQGDAISVTIQGANTCWTSGNVAIAVTRSGATGSVAVGAVTVDETRQKLTTTFTPSSDATVGDWTVTVTDSATTITACQALTSTFRVDIKLLPFLISSQPDEGEQGTSNLDVTIVGVNTNFAQGTSTVEFRLNGAADTDITVNSVTVANDDPSTEEDESKTILTANIDIASGAALGFRDVRVTTGAEVADGLEQFTVTPAPDTLEVDVRIVSPRDGAFVSGTSVPVRAVVVISDFSRLVDVVFDVDGTEFGRLTRRPFVASLDADSLIPTSKLAYLLAPPEPVTITVTVNATNADPATATITVTPVLPEAAEVSTDQDEQGRDRTQVTITQGVGLALVTPSGQTIELAPQVTTGLSNSTAAERMRATEKGAGEINIDDESLLDRDTGVNREPVTGIDVNFLDNQGNPLASDKTKNAPAEIVLCYSDDDGDGIVDGTNIPEITLLMFWDSDDDGDLDLQISTSSDVDTDENCVTGTVPGFSGGGIVGSPSAPSAPSVSAGGGGSSCFIATAAYGTPFAYDIDILRAFRDRFLVDNAVGRAFVETYYKLSPGPAEYISRHDGLRAATRMVLKPVVFGAWMFMEKDRAAWTSLFLISGLAGMVITLGVRRRKGKSARRR